MWAVDYLWGTGMGVASLLLGILLAGGPALAIYWKSDSIVLRMTGARPVEPLVHPHLHQVTEGLAIAAGIPAPRLYTIETEVPNAFATGRKPERAVVAVTTGLLKRLNRQELEGVIAHELAHVRNYDVLLVTVAAVLAGMVMRVADLGLRTGSYGRGGLSGGGGTWGGGPPARLGSGRGRGTGIKLGGAARSGGSGRSNGRGGGGGILIVIAILALLLAPLVAGLIKMAISRRREFLADAEAVRLTRYPAGLRDALKKLAAEKQDLTVNDALAPLFIVNPLRDRSEGSLGRSIHRLFQTHPPIEERIRRLEAM